MKDTMDKTLFVIDRWEWPIGRSGEVDTGKRYYVDNNSTPTIGSNLL
jgi:hypothetical protein